MVRRASKFPKFLFHLCGIFRWLPVYCQKISSLCCSYSFWNSILQKGIEENYMRPASMPLEDHIGELSSCCRASETRETLGWAQDVKPDRISMDLSVMASDTVKVGLDLRCGKSSKKWSSWWKLCRFHWLPAISVTSIWWCPHPYTPRGGRRTKGWTSSRASCTFRCQAAAKQREERSYNSEKTNHRGCCCFLFLF